MAVPVAGTEALDAFDRDLSALHDRLQRLRDSPEGGAAAPAAGLLQELAAAVEQLRRLHESVTGRAEDASTRQSTGDRERQLLRAVFRDLPFAVLLLDRDGRIRRASQRCHDLLGVGPDYLSGKPLAVFCDVTDRSTLRVQLARVIREGVAQRAEAALLHRDRRLPAILALSPVGLPGDPRPLVAVVITVAGPDAVGSPGGSADTNGSTRAAGSPLRHDPAESGDADPDSEEIRAVVRGQDVLRDVTRILLEEAGGRDAVVLQRAASRLALGLGDWVLVDVLRDGQPTRAVVAGPAAERDSPLLRALERADVQAAGLPCEVIDTNAARLLPHVADLGVLGRDERGVDFLGALGVHSLLCVPITGGDAAGGALTMLRTSTSAPYRLAELAAAQEIGELLARAVPSPLRGDEPAAEPPEPYLPQRMLTSDRIDVAWTHLAGRRGAAPFLDFYNRPGGWGASIGSAEVGGTAANAHVAMIRQWSLLLGSSGLAPSEILFQLDGGLRRLRPGEPPISAAMITMTPHDDSVATMISSAGHRSSLCVRTDGRVQRTDGGGTALNAGDGVSVHEDTDHLAPGDCLVFYTNELPEVTNEAGETFAGSGELAQCLARVAGQPARKIIDALVTGLHGFAPRGWSDAVAAVAIRCTGGG